jgi:hypothetical protein
MADNIDLLPQSQLVARVQALPPMVHDLRLAVAPFTTWVREQEFIRSFLPGWRAPDGFHLASNFTLSFHGHA